MEKVMDNATESKAIRQRMEQVRRDLDEDVQDIVEGSRDISDWRSYVRTYPWVCLGAALAVGCWIVPRRNSAMQPDAQTLAELAKQSRLLATSTLPTKGNVSGMLLSFVGNLAMREVASYVGKQVGKLVAARAAKSQQDDQQ